MTYKTPLWLIALTAFTALTFTACVGDDSDESSESSSTIVIADMSDTEIERFCDDSVLQIQQLQAQMQCYEPAFSAQVMGEEVSATCESDVSACLSGLSVTLDKTKPCSDDAPEGSPSCYDDCVEGIKAQRTNGCQATTSLANSCFDAQTMGLTGTAAEACDGTLLARFFEGFAEEGEEPPPPAACAEFEMLCPDETPEESTTESGAEG